MAALVLAAGRATRFGATKQLALVDGHPLVRHPIHAAVAAGLDPVVVVVGHDDEAVRAVLPDGVRVVVNRAFAEGQSTSLHAGLRVLEPSDADAVVVLLADEPGVRAADITAVLGPLADGAPLVRARYTDRPGHPVVLHRTVWPDALATSGDAGARALLRSSAVVHVTVPRLAPTDVDTTGDLDRLRSRAVPPATPRD